MLLTCQNCNRVLPDPHAIFCDQCGAPIDLAKTQPTVAKEHLSLPPYSRDTSHKRGPWKVIAIVVIIIFGGLIVNSIFEEPRKETKRTGSPNKPAFTEPSPPAPTKPPESFAQSLASAKRLLQREGLESELSYASQKLTAMPSSAPEYKEAQRVLSKIQKKLEEFRKQAEIDAHPLEVVKSTWWKDGFDTVAMWRVTFYNRSNKPVGNIKYRTAYYAETGAKVDAGGVDALLGKDTIQKVIRPHQKRTLEINDGFVHSEASTATFEVVSWEFIYQ